MAYNFFGQDENEDQNIDENFGSQLRNSRNGQQAGASNSDSSQSQPPRFSGGPVLAKFPQQQERPRFSGGPVLYNGKPEGGDTSSNPKPQISPSSTPLGPEGSVISGNQPAQQGASGQGSGTFTNLQSYLDANKGRNFGEQVAGKVQGEVNKAYDAESQADTGFRNLSDQGTTRSDQNLLGQVKSDPNALANNQDQYNSWLKQRDAKYSGPNNLVDTQYYNPTQQALTRAQEVAKATEDEGGRKAYLQEQYGSGVGRNDYTSGMQNLDNLLISQDPNSKAAFQSARDSAKNAGDQFSTLNSALSAYAGQNSAATADARKQARDTIGIDDAGNYNNGGQIGTDVGALDQNVAARKGVLADEHKALDPIGQMTNISQLNDQQRKMTGLNDSQFSGFNLKPGNMGSYEPYYASMRQAPGDFYRVNAGNYSSFVNDNDVNRSSVASQDQTARIQALSKLAGIDQNFISDPSQAGKYTNGDLYNYDKGGFLTSVNGQRGGLEQAIRNIDQAPSGTGISDLGYELAQINRQRNAFGLNSVNPQLEAGPNKGGDNPGGIAAPGGNPPYVAPTPIPPGDPREAYTPPAQGAPTPQPPGNYNGGGGVGYQLPPQPPIYKPRPPGSGFR